MRKTRFIVAGWLIVLLAACGGADPTPAPSATPVPPSATPAPTSTPVVIPQVERAPALSGQLRVVHASPDLPAVDLYLDGARIGTGFTEGLYNTQPLAFVAGSYTLRVVESGATDAPPLLDYPLDLQHGDSLILLLHGTPDEPAITAYAEDLSPLPEGMARVTALNAMPRGPAVDVRMDTAPLLDAVPFGALAGPELVPAGRHRVEMVSGEDTLAEMDLQLAGRIAYTLMLVPNGDGARLVTLQSPSQERAELRVIHAAPDAPVLRVTVDDEAVADELTFGAASDWHELDAGSHTLRVASAADGVPLYEAPLTMLWADVALDVVVMGPPDALTVAQVPDDRSPLPQYATRLLFVNAVPGSERLTVSTFAGDLAEASPLAYGAAAGPLQRRAGQVAYQFTSGTGEDLTLVAQTPDRIWEAGRAYVIIATGAAIDAPVIIEDEVGTDDRVLTDEGVVEDPLAGVGTARLRVVNALANGTRLDVTLRGEPLATGLQAGTGTAYSARPRVEADLVVRASEGEAILLEAPFEPPEDGDAFTLFLYGTRDEVQVVTASDDLQRGAAGEAALRVLHLAPDQPDLRLAGQGPVAADTVAAAEPTPESTPLPAEDTLVSVARYAEPSDPALLLPGAYRVHVLNYSTDFRLYTEPTLMLERGRAYDLLILPDGSGLSVALFLVPIPD